MVIDDIQDNSETGTIYPPRILREWLDQNSLPDFYEKLKRKVWGQDEELRKAAIMIYGFLTAMANNKFDRKFHFLIEGPSASGKSTFSVALSQILPCPVIIGDSSALSPAGYRGADIADLLNTDEFKQFWGCSVLILDEADKMMQETHSSEGNFHLETLHTLLKCLDGGTIVNRSGESVPCDKVLVIAMGAFTPLRETPKDVSSRNIGFYTDRLPETARTAQKPRERQIDKNRMLDFCGSEQFLGRFLTVLHFKSLEKDIFLKILYQTESEIREVYGCGFDLPRNERVRIVEEAMASPYGGRFIKSAVWEAFLSSTDEWGIMKKPSLYPHIDLDAYFEENIERIMSA